METQARGALVMRVEHLQAWLAKKNRVDRKYTKKWDKVVDIIQPAFKRGKVTVECSFQTAILILKGKG